MSQSQQFRFQENEIGQLRHRVAELEAENARYRKLIPDLRAAEEVERLYRSLVYIEAQKPVRTKVRANVIDQLAKQPADALRAHDGFMRWYSGSFKDWLGQLGVLKHPLIERVES